jgi:hypothetical protein
MNVRGNKVIVPAMIHTAYRYAPRLPFGFTLKCKQGKFARIWTSNATLRRDAVKN